MDNQLLEALTREGVLINVSVRYWRGTKKLKAEDLGLDPNTVEERLISLGHKKLLPKESLQPFALIEGRTHALVDAATFPFLGGLGRFLPNAKLAGTTSRLDELEAEFFSVKDKFLGNYAQMRLEARQEWYAAASRLLKDPDQLVATIEASFPNPERMDRSFGFATQLFQVRAPEGLELDPVSIREQQEVLRAREQAAQEAALKISRGAEEFVADCVASLREQTARLCEEMLQSMHNGKSGVHQKTLNRLVRFIEEFKQLNFAGDHQMEEQLERVRREFLGRTAEEYRDSRHYKQKLRQGLQELADAAREMAAEDSRELVENFGRMGRRRFHKVA